MSKTMPERLAIVETEMHHIKYDVRTVLQNQDTNREFVTSEFAKMNARLDKVASVWGIVVLLITAIVTAIVGAIKLVSGKS